MRKQRLSKVFVFITIFVFGCDRKFPPPPPLARLDVKFITWDWLVLSLSLLSERRGEEVAKRPGKLRNHVQARVRDMIFAHEARTLGYDRDPINRRRWALQEKKKLSLAYFGIALGDHAGLSHGEVLSSRFGKAWRTAHGDSGGSSWELAFECAMPSLVDSILLDSATSDTVDKEAFLGKARQVVQKRGWIDLKTSWNLKIVATPDSLADSIPDSRVLAFVGDTVLSTLGDLRFALTQSPESPLDPIGRFKFLEYLLIWELGARESLRCGFSRAHRVRALLDQEAEIFWAGVYRDSVLRLILTDLVLAGALPDKAIEVEYALHPEKYSERESLAIPAILASLRNRAWNAAESDQVSRLKVKHSFQVFDSLLFDLDFSDLRLGFRRGLAEQAAGRRDRAILLLQEVQRRTPVSDPLHDSLTFVLAEIHLQVEDPRSAVEEFMRHAYLFPRSPYNSKSLAMISVLWSRHLGNTEAGRRALELLRSRHPLSEEYQALSSIPEQKVR